MATVGELLTADAGTWLPDPVALSYIWSRDGVAIDGATSSTYRLVSADVGAVITVTVTGTKTGFLTVSATSAGTDAVVDLVAPESVRRAEGAGIVVKRQETTALVSVGAQLEVV